MKKLFFIAALAIATLSASAQEQGKIRVGTNLGLGFPNAGLGFAIDLDARYNITNNINAGILLTSFGGFKDLSADVNSGLTTMTMGGSSGYLAHGDYYFSEGTSSFAPFLGAGLGGFNVSNIQVSSDESGSTGSLSFSDATKFGGVIRGGFEAGHFRMGLSYYLIPSSDLYDLNGARIGTTGNSYLNLTLGFYLGGGHWKK